MLNVTFTFCANRESDPNTAQQLFDKHFPGATRLGYRKSWDSSYRITCTSDEFVQWMVERDQMGFVNRMHQLNLAIEVPAHHHFPVQQQQPTVKLRLIEYATPHARGL